MKRWSLLQLARLAPVAAAGVALAGRAHAAPAADLSPVGQQLEGTWMLTIQFVGAPPPGVPPVLPVMNTFLPGGALLETGANMTTRSPGHGQRDSQQAHDERSRPRCATDEYPTGEHQVREGDRGDGRDATGLANAGMSGYDARGAPLTAS